MNETKLSAFATYNKIGSRRYPTWNDHALFKLYGQSTEDDQTSNVWSCRFGAVANQNIEFDLKLFVLLEHESISTYHRDEAFHQK